MELRQLRQFIILAETLNFRVAAERLNMTQPPLSVSLRKLEAELGSPLLDRTTREVRLTAVGLGFLDHARRTLFEADEARQAARAVSIGDEGVLSVGFVGTATYEVLPELIPAFRVACPRVQLILRESTTTEILLEIEAHKLDLGIVRAPLLRPGRIVLDHIENDHLILALPSGHPMAGQKEVALSDLKGEPFITYSPRIVPSLHAVVMFACQQAGFVPNIVQEAIQVQTIISLVQSGLGVALVPSVVTRRGYEKTLFRRLSKLDATTSISLAIAHLHGREIASARRFCAVAAALKRRETLLF